MKFIKVKATGHRNNNSNDTFDAEFILNTDLIKSITLDGEINLKEDGNLNVNNNCLLDNEVYFNPIKIHDSVIDDFLREYV